MTPNEWASRFSEAVVSELKAEMGRRSLSSRALGRMVGENSQYMSMRLDGGNPRTGKRVALGVDDLVAFCSALGLSVAEVVRRAEGVAKESFEPSNTEVLDFATREPVVEIVTDEIVIERQPQTPSPEVD